MQQYSPLEIRIPPLAAYQTSSLALSRAFQTPAADHQRWGVVQVVAMFIVSTLLLFLCACFDKNYMQQSYVCCPCMHETVCDLCLHTSRDGWCFY